MDGESAATTRFFQVIIAVLALVGIYYLYQYLFGGAGMTSTTLLGPKTVAQTDPAKPIVIPSSNMPGMYEGGEFSISMWLYIQNWSYRAGKNKHILSIGGTNFDTIRVYLAGNKPQLKVRLHTRDSSQVTTTTSSSGVPSDALEKSTITGLFQNIETDSGMLDASPLCDLPEIDLQRWVQITISINGKTCDVYMDGKLARSCVLPSFYKVDKSGYNATVLGFGGFGGYVASMNMYSYAMTPDQIYHAYMAGPAPITDFGAYLKSFFEPRPTNINV